MASNNHLINAENKLDMGVIAEMIVSNASANIGLYMSVSGQYVIDIGSQAAGDVFSENQLAIVKGKSKPWLPKATYSIEDIHQNQDGDYLIVLVKTKPGKASVHATQLIDDLSGRAIGGLSKMAVATWAESQLPLDEHLSLTGIDLVPVSMAYFS